MAGFIHSGLLIEGYQHREVRVAEGVIATWIVPRLSRVVGLAAQTFALLGSTSQIADIGVPGN